MKEEVQIFIGADHAGYSLKEKIKKFLDKKRISYKDLGGLGRKNDDYPDFALKVAKGVSNSKGKSKGILICGSGNGMTIVANKVKGIRAVVGYDNYSVKMSKQDNNANVLCLRNRGISQEKNLKFLNLWLKTDFSELKRHKRRIEKISKAERK